MKVFLISKFFTKFPYLDVNVFFFFLIIINFVWSCWKSFYISSIFSWPTILSFLLSCSWGPSLSTVFTSQVLSLILTIWPSLIPLKIHVLFSPFFFEIWFNICYFDVIFTINETVIEKSIFINTSAFFNLTMINVKNLRFLCVTIFWININISDYIYINWWC